MATVSLRMRDDLKRKAQHLAKRQGVSLNGFINATVAPPSPRKKHWRYSATG